MFCSEVYPRVIGEGGAKVSKRIYIHSRTPMAALVICEELACLLNQLKFGISWFKINPPDDPLRKDNIVVYLISGGQDGNDYVRTTLGELGNLDRLRSYFGQSLP